MFRAYEPERDRLVAVKVFRLDLPPERAHQLVAEFEQLIDVGLRHPSMTAPVATGLDGVVAYLAQDYFSGDSLDIVLRQNGPSSVAEGLRVARRLAEALDFAAEHGVEHGAIHPRDVLLSPEGTRLVGLGVTRALERVGASVPIRRPYTAPERVDGAAWDRRADVFSLAAVVHELLWGRRLVGTGLQAVEAMTPLPGAHLTALQAVFARALAEQAVDRFETATEFVESLEATVGAVDAAAAEPEATAIEAPVQRLSRGRLRVVDPRDAAPPFAELMLPLDEEPEPPFQYEEPEPIQYEEPVFVRDAEPPVIQLAPPEPVSDASDLPLAMTGEPMAEAAIPFAEIPPVEPEPVREVADRAKPISAAAEPAAQPLFLTPLAPAASPVWPIGLACMVGVALGFGAGYTVAIRDRASVGPAPGAVQTVAPAPAGPVFTESTVGPRPAVDAKAAGDLRLPPEAAATATAADTRTVAPEAPAAPFTGRLVVRTTPVGARVFVDGRDRGASPATVTDLGRGEHRIRMVRDGYTAAERRIVLSPSRPSQSLTVPLAREPRARASVPVSPEPNARPPAKADASPNATAGSLTEAGMLAVESRPVGATVFVDGRAVGRTPLNVPGVKAGDHTVRLELEGHRPWTASIKIVGGAPNRVGASLEK